MKKAKLKAMRTMAAKLSEEKNVAPNMVYRRIKEAYKSGQLILKKK